MEGVPLGIGDGVGRRGRDPRDWEMEGNPKEQGMEWEVDRGPSGAGDGGGAPKSGGWTGELGMELRQLGMGDRRDPPWGGGQRRETPRAGRRQGTLRNREGTPPGAGDRRGALRNRDAEPPNLAVGRIAAVPIAVPQWVQRGQRQDAGQARVHQLRAVGVAELGLQEAEVGVQEYGRRDGTKFCWPCHALAGSPGLEETSRSNTNPSPPCPPLKDLSRPIPSPLTLKDPPNPTIPWLYDLSGPF